jgi:hypothetical protein
MATISTDLLGMAEKKESQIFKTWDERGTLTSTSRPVRNTGE